MTEYGTEGESLAYEADNWNWAEYYDKAFRSRANLKWPDGTDKCHPSKPWSGFEPWKAKVICLRPPFSVA